MLRFHTTEAVRETVVGAQGDQGRGPECGYKSLSGSVWVPRRLQHGLNLGPNPVSRLGL